MLKSMIQFSGTRSSAASCRCLISFLNPALNLSRTSKGVVPCFGSALIRCPDTPSYRQADVFLAHIKVFTPDWFPVNVIFPDSFLMKADTECNESEAPGVMFVL